MKINKSINWIIIALAFLLPIFFLPTTAEFYNFNKQTLLIFTSGLLLILWALRMVEEKTLSFKKTPLDLPILFFAFIYILATIFASPNKVEGLVNSNSTGTILALTALYFVITNNLRSSALRSIFSALITSASLLGLVAIYQTIGLGEAFAPVEWMKPKTWTPSGGSLTLITFLGVNFLVVVVLFLRKFNQRNWLLSAWYLLACFLISIGLFITIYQILPGKPTSILLPPFLTSWAVAIESFKQNPFFGVGPGNYLSAFNRFRPISYNNYDFWNVRFVNAANYLFEILAIGGILTFGAYLYLILKTIRLWQKKYRRKELSDNQLGLLLGLVGLLIAQLVLPINVLVLSITFLFLSFLSLDQAKSESSAFPSKTLPSVILIIVGFLVIPSYYFWGRAYAADVYFQNSLKAFVQNRGTDAYNLQIKAINLNPYGENYRLAYSQTNFILANALAGQTELSDQGRADISTLIQQAIREAKIATVLNRTRAGHWENLAQLYRNLINFAQGSEQWAITAYRQAIATDPINPRIRVNLGGLYYALGDFAEAEIRFRNAVNLKPDYANGYYNLAAAFRQQEKYTEAFNAMQIVASLVPVDAADYQKIMNELEELRGKLPAKEVPTEILPSTPGELTEPAPLPSPAIEPPIELPEEAGPEIPETSAEKPEISPSPSP